MTIEKISNLYYESLRRQNIAPEVAYNQMCAKFPTFNDIPVEIINTRAWRTILADIYECHLQNKPYQSFNLNVLKFLDKTVEHEILIKIENNYYLTDQGIDVARGSWHRLGRKYKTKKLNYATIALVFCIIVALVYFLF